MSALAGEPTLDWLRKVRIGQRLIGPFGFSHVGRAFDGVATSMEVILRPLPGLSSRTSFHNLRVVESADLWYQGAGATLKDRDRPDGFGYAGRPANGHHNLFQVTETSLGYD